MKNRITFFFLQGLAVSAVAFLGQDAKAQTTLYDNSTTTQAGNYSYSLNGGFGEVGNEIVLAGGPDDYISSFGFQFFFTGSGTPSGSPSVTLNFYENNGGPVSGFPNTQFPAASPVFSQSFALTAFTGSTPGIGSGQATLTFNPDVIVDQDFTWTVSFSGVASGESAGLSIFNGTKNSSGVPIPATGYNYNDAWVNSAAQGAAPSWSLVQANTGDPGLQFAAVASGTPVPEPTTIALGIIGAGSFLARRRKS